MSPLFSTCKTELKIQIQIAEIYPGNCLHQSVDSVRGIYQGARVATP